MTSLVTPNDLITSKPTTTKALPEGTSSPSIIQTNNNNNNNNIPNKTTNAKSPKLKQKQRRLTDRFGFYLDGTRDGKQTSRRPSRIQIFLETKRERKWRKMLNEHTPFIENNTIETQNLSRKQKIFKRRVRKGIPNSVRSHAWWVLSNAKEIQNKCNNNDNNNETYYQRLCKISNDIFKSHHSINNNSINNQYYNKDKEEQIQLHKYISTNYKWDNVIKEDLTRTYPNHILFDIKTDTKDDPMNMKGIRTLNALQRILRCYGLSNQTNIIKQLNDDDDIQKKKDNDDGIDNEIKKRQNAKNTSTTTKYFGYTQGMNFIAGMFLSYMPEEQSFYMLKTVMESPYYNMQGLFSDKTPLIPL